MAVAYLVGLSFLVQVASAPNDDGFYSNLGLYFGRFWPAVAGFLITSFLYALVLALTNSHILSTLLSGLLLVPAALANCGKLSTLDSPLLPTDVLRIGDTARVFDVDYLALPAGGKLAILLAGVLCLLILGALLPKPRLRWPGRSAVFVTVALCFSTLFVRQWNCICWFPAALPDCGWSPTRGYRDSGFLAFMAMHLPNAWIEKPSGYSDETIDRLCAGLKPEAQAGVPARPPSLIMILGESFWDPTGMTGVRFAPDPVPTFHELQNRNGQIDLISPVFGGTTCNAEFEMLSGLNMAFLPNGHIRACIDYVQRPLPALPAVLREHGYSTIKLEAQGGMHNPRQVQPLLGFEQYASGDWWKNQERIGQVVNDLSVAKEILECSTRLKRPYFICVNTIEGHSPYHKGKYPGDEMSIRVSGPNVVDDEAKEILETYAEGLHRADAALKYLIEHLSVSEDPVLVVFYGDHQPSFDSNRSLYRRTGHWDGSDAAQMAKLHQTRAVIWSNYGAQLKPRTQLLSMCHVPAIVLEMLKVPAPVQMRFLAGIRARWPVISVSGCVSEAGQPVPWVEAEVAPDVHAYELLQYDIMFGQQYCTKHAASP